MLKFLQFTLMRAVMSILTLVIVSFIVFSMMELVPGNCAERYIAFKNTQGQNITVEDIRAEERRLGLDRPYLIRAFSWMGNVFFKGEFGDSCILRLNINYLLSDKVWISLGISLAALFFSYLVAIPIGIYSAVSRNPIANNLVRFISYLGLALPQFSVGADDHAHDYRAVWRIHVRPVFQGIPRRGLVLCQIHGFYVKGLAAGFHPRLGRDRICFADGARPDAR
jgi:ABC-type dipeptide/oligopeptide/nickel transport system permease component